jgi:FAD/FMN-containing dehydrogenase
MPNPLAQLPFDGDIILRGDDRLTGYNHDTMLTGDPDALVRPANATECQEILRYCHGQKIPVTVCAGRTAMTGSSVAQSGLLLSIEKMNRVLDIGIHEGRLFATAQPGIFLGAFQAQMHDAGYYYPPSPTSRHEAMLGATIATNATGDNTYKYGTTRRYIRALKVLLASGEEHIVTRPTADRVTELKNTAGYFLGGSTIDHFIGSEGTLGLITEVTVDLLPKPFPHFMLMIFFPSNTAALHAVSTLHTDPRVSPSAIEYIDGEALKIMATHATFPTLPETIGAALICTQEYAEEMYDPLLTAWFAILEGIDMQMPKLLEHTILATQPTDAARISTWRHHIPAHVNESGQRLQTDGGGKVGSDWWVPIAEMPAMMAYMYAESDPLGIPYLAFGHLGNGHPHVNYLTRNAGERARARTVMHACCRKAVALGGGVAGEHGLGKIKHDLLAIQHAPEVIAQMRALKEHYDTHWILGRGNILAPPAVIG